MKATTPWLGTLLLAFLFVPHAQAQWCPLPIPPAPDACGPGFYCANECGQVYGPNYCVYPPFPPFQGMLPVPQSAQAAPTLFGHHAFIRGPRDFYMVD